MRGKCESCGDEVEDGQIDHHVPRSAFGKDSTGNYKYLCQCCHKHKTVEDNNIKINIEESNLYCSRFNEHTMEHFVRSRKPTQVVCELHELVTAPIWECDVNSCRYNAITKHNLHPVPIFSPLDTLQIVTIFDFYDYLYI